MDAHASGCSKGCSKNIEGGQVAQFGDLETNPAPLEWSASVPVYHIQPESLNSLSVEMLPEQLDRLVSSQRNVADPFDGIQQSGTSSAEVGDNLSAGLPSNGNTCWCFQCKSSLCPWYKTSCGTKCYPGSWIQGKCPSGSKLVSGSDGNWKCEVP